MRAAQGGLYGHLDLGADPIIPRLEIDERNGSGLRHFLCLALKKIQR